MLKFNQEKLDKEYRGIMAIDCLKEMDKHPDFFSPLSYYRHEEEETPFLAITLSENLNNFFKIIGDLNILVRNSDEIKAYLIDHLKMLNLFIQICGETVEQFGSKSQLSLEMFYDHDSSDNYPVIFIRQLKYDDDIRESIEKLWSKYETMLQRYSGEFVVMTDYQSPR